MIALAVVVDEQRSAFWRMYGWFLVGRGDVIDTWVCAVDTEHEHKRSHLGCV